MRVEQTIITPAEFSRVWAAPLPRDARLSLVADMCRLNTLTAVKRAGSGHLGSSFSAMDVVVWLYYARMNTTVVGIEAPDRDVYFSSKGHDVPGLYSVLHSLGILTTVQLASLRRLGGLDGHPDVGVRGVEVNSGSLGMGISKGRGIAWAKRRLGSRGHVFVMTGDGELQEGQNYEALQGAVQHRLSGLTVIVDANKVQSDKLVCEIVDLADLVTKVKGFGWNVARCDGHDFAALDQALDAVLDPDRPGLIVADTIKGRGVSFMEHPAALQAGGGSYPWHAGAPADEAFERARTELLASVSHRFSVAELGPLSTETLEPEFASSRPRVVQELAGEPVSPVAQAKMAAGVSDEYVARAYGEALLEIGRRRPDLVVLDGDLAADCRVRDFELQLPAQFIENGIAEQDMVSMAAGLARHGLLPVVNSFASFLASRANEQIYNAASERSHIVYALHYAGLIPAGPGKSHQSLRDISLLGALPGATVVQPCNALESRELLEHLVERCSGVCAIRLCIGPSPRRIALPDGYHPQPGCGVALTAGDDALLIAYGPVMLHEALIASELLAERGFGLAVVNMPWLTVVDDEWLAATFAVHERIYVLEDHSPVGGLGDRLVWTGLRTGTLGGLRRLEKLGVDGWPACGTPSQALQFHGLDGASLAERILAAEPAGRGLR